MDDEVSPAQRLIRDIRHLPHDRRIAWLRDHLASFTEQDLHDLNYDWRFWARPEQVPPKGDWSVWLIRAGRQSGKTRSAAEAVRAAIEHVERIALVAPTANSARMVMWEGESGLMKVFPHAYRPFYEPTKLTVTFYNGARGFFYCVSADTEVFTHDRGWVSHEQLSKEDVIRTLNTSTGLAEWQPVRQVHRFFVRSEPMIETKMHRHSSLVTRNHRWPVRNKLNGRIRFRDSILDFNTKDSFIKSVPGADIPTVETVSTDMAALVGWWSAEGSIYHLDQYAIRDTEWNPGAFRSFVREWMRKHKWTYASIAERDGNWNADQVRWVVCKHGGRLRTSRTRLARALGIPENVLDEFFLTRPRRLMGTIAQSVTSPHLSTIEAVLTRLWGAPTGLTGVRRPAWRINHGGRLIQFALNDEAVQLITKFAHGFAKVVSSDFVDILTVNQLEVFVRSFMAGDGHWKGDSGELVQKVPARLVAVERACILLGWDTRMSPVKTQGAMLSIRTRDSSTAPLTTSKDRRRVVLYTGTVWCPEVANSTWLARKDGTVYFTGNSGEEPERLRGPAHGFAWVDELRAFRYEAEAWSNLKLGMSLGRKPRIVVSTTPRPSSIIRQLVKEAASAQGKVVETRMTTYDNRANLPASYIEDMIAEYEGTRHGRQELHAELLEDVEGAMLNVAQIEAATVSKADAPGEYERVVIGIDPSTGSGLGDECGIVVMGWAEGVGYVLADLSIRGSPAEWGRAIVAANAAWRPDRIACEKAFGQEQLARLVVDPLAVVPWRFVSVHHAKEVRAEPVAAQIEQLRVRFVGSFPKLEEQWCTWVPPSRGGSGPSPDRLDAMCTAATELMVGRGKTTAHIGHISQRLATTRERPREPTR